MSNPQSVERQFRARRFRHMRAMIDACLREKETVEILDLGGTEDYWRIAEDYLAQNAGRIHITMVNNEPGVPPSSAAFSAAAGDACDPELFAGRRFDIVHSNSVIEHVGDEARMAAFADNVRRLSDRFFVQTPNYWFPLEPHFRFVGFQWLPLGMRIALMQRFNLGFFPRARSYEEAHANVAEIRLLDRRMMRCLFPEAAIVDEKIFGLTKSLMAIRGKGRD
ncbi:class I SAM-dependent methyltransferase [Jiella marina]|uniref:class I SAM-dependent methyltransferase n=1 Tax=Jiella sp. LLJ827 TaxID=2917712 RepID=UPI002100AAAE|nr:class I SAM-dependent methyltransferase [Jiella sp. LLJ827]MCQ0988342.1 class I SAM-dependent methyltransferase [Jiella sp. LLJ827]